jgi:hypothetical protein
LVISCSFLSDTGNGEIAISGVLNINSGDLSGDGFGGAYTGSGGKLN